MNKFWPDIFVGVACFTLMQAAVIGNFVAEVAVEDTLLLHSTHFAYGPLLR
jgi:hypothetical protein